VAWHRLATLMSENMTGKFEQTRAMHYHFHTSNMQTQHTTTNMSKDLTTYKRANDATDAH